MRTHYIRKFFFVAVMSILYIAFNQSPSFAIPISSEFLEVFDYLNKQNPNGELRGPVIKGFQLGMHSKDAISKFEEQFGECRIKEYKDNENLVGMIVSNKDNNIQLYFDKNAKIVSIYFIKEGIDKAFGTSGKREGFTKKFAEAYNIKLQSRDALNPDDIISPLLEISTFKKVIDNEFIEDYNRIDGNTQKFLLELVMMETNLGLDNNIEMNIKNGYIVKCVRELTRNEFYPKEVDFIGIYAIDKDRQDLNKSNSQNLNFN